VVGNTLKRAQLIVCYYQPEKKRKPKFATASLYYAFLLFSLTEQTKDVGLLRYMIPCSFIGHGDMRGSAFLIYIFNIYIYIYTYIYIYIWRGRERFNPTSLDKGIAPTSINEGLLTCRILINTSQKVIF
jgi:hypothetical protein